MLTSYLMDKPKGGRGKEAPYETKQMRVPVGLEAQVQELISRFRGWIFQSGFHSGIGTSNPPWLLDKPVDNFEDALAPLDLEAERDRFLTGLRCGKQAPEYKRTKATLDRFIAAVGSQRRGNDS